MSCPGEYANVLLGERFGHWPWDIEDAPADRVYFYTRLLGIEGQAARHLERLPRGERSIKME